MREVYPADPNGVRPIRHGVLDWADRGAVWEWHGVRCGALGGGISIDRRMRVEGETCWPTEAITDAGVDTLTGRAADGLDVLFDHDAPMLPPGLRLLGDVVLRADCAVSTRQVARAVAATEPAVLLQGTTTVATRRRLVRRGSKVWRLIAKRPARDPGSCSATSPRRIPVVAARCITGDSRR